MLQAIYLIVMNIGTFLMFFPLACVAGEMENPGRDRIRPETAASMKTLCREVTAAEKQSFQNPSFDGTRYSIPDAPPYWDADSRSLVSRSMGRNEANNPCYTETRKTLSPDGMLLTTIRMRKVRDSRPFFEKEVHRAVFPYLFVDSLTDIVEKRRSASISLFGMWTFPRGSWPGFTCGPICCTPINWSRKISGIQAPGSVKMNECRGQGPLHSSI